MYVLIYTLVQKDKTTTKKHRNSDWSNFFLSKIHIFINVFSNKIIYQKIFWKFFSLINISENIKINMLQKDKVIH